MIARPTILAATALLAATPAFAQEACPQSQAVYTEKANGYTLSFREPEPWEASPSTSAVLTLTFPDGSIAWGITWMPNGTSWNKARLFNGCKLDGPLDEATGDPLPGSTEQEFNACEVWRGVIYQLTGDDVDYLPFREDPAAPAILFTDLGPTIRYSGMVLSPGDEPHDVFTLSGCNR